MGGKPIIYQVLPRLFGNTNTTRIPDGSFNSNGCGKLNDFSIEILKSIKDLGCTHIWFTGIIRHATKTSFSNYNIAANHPSIVKGEAGSPYAITDYYDIAPAIATNVESRMSEFEALIERCSKLSIKVIIDLVPNHLSREYHSLNNPLKMEHFGANDRIEYQFHPMNNFFYISGSSFQSPASHPAYPPFVESPAKVTGNNCNTPSPSKEDWYETIKLNYGEDLFGDGRKYFTPMPSTWLKMRDIMEFWLSKGVTGFRCDMAEMVPEEFWQWSITQIKKNYPNSLFIGEVYNLTLYNTFLKRCKFDYIYDKVGLYDTLKDITKGVKACSTITQCWQQLGDLENRVLNFIENHDEVRAASNFYASDPYKALPAFTTSLLLNSAPHMIYFGQELGERGMESEGFSGIDGKTSIFDYWSLDSVIIWLKNREETPIRKIYSKLLNLVAKEDAFYHGEKFDLQYANLSYPKYDSRHTFAFARKGKKSLFIVVTNFSKEERDLSLIIPSHLFSYFGITKRERWRAEDIILEESVDIELSENNSLNLGMTIHGVKIVKLLL